MATTGETIWASLIARQKTLVDPQTPVRGVYLTFSFGRYVRYRTPLTPLSEFRFTNYVYDHPSRLRPGVHLHFVFKRNFGRLSEQMRFKIVWPYTSMPFKGVWRYRFSFRNYSVSAQLNAHETSRFSGYRRVFFFNPSRVQNQNRQAITPAQLFNLSLIAGTLAPRGEKLRGVRQRIRGPFHRKLQFPRPNPDVINVGYKRAIEIYPAAYSESTVQDEIYRREWTGTTTPGFGSKLKSQLPVNPHTVKMHRSNYNIGYDLRRTFASPNTTYNNGWGTNLYFGLSAALTSIQITDSQFSEVSNAAIKKLNSNANVGVQANMAQNLAQYSQTTNMIARNAIRIASSMRALRRGQFSQAVDALFENSRPKGVSIRKGNLSKSKSLANNWLELQYGWKPLLSDIDESMRGLADYMAGSSSYQKVTGVANKALKAGGPISGPVQGALPAVGFTSHQSMYSCRFGCEYKVVNHQTAFLSQLGFTNPINLLWEILPYSFVVDWFIPIGPYLESLSAPHGLEFVRGYKTLFGRKYTTRCSAYSGKMPGAVTSEFRCFGDQDRMSIVLERTSLSAWPVQSFPTFKNPFSTTHALNAIALLRQSFRR